MAVNNSVHAYSSATPIVLNQWTHIYFGVNYTNPANQTTLMVYLNQNLTSPIIITPEPFMDSINSFLFIGSFSNISNYYRGFIYSLEIYADFAKVNSLVTVNSPGAYPAVLPSGASISTCSINSFYSAIQRKCINCLEGCPSCRYDGNCSLCSDTNCLVCDSYSLKTCSSCSSGFTVTESQCMPCNDTFYFDESVNSCVPCQGLCMNCVAYT